MSPLGLLNFLVLQWFGVRLAKVVKKEFVTMHIGLDVPLYRDVFVRWTVLRWIWPLTGWWSDDMRRDMSASEGAGSQELVEAAAAPVATENTTAPRFHPAKEEPMNLVNDMRLRMLEEAAKDPIGNAPNYESLCIVPLTAHELESLCFEARQARAAARYSRSSTRHLEKVTALAGVIVGQIVENGGTVEAAVDRALDIAEVLINRATARANAVQPDE